MPTPRLENIKTFASYEDREAAFSRSVFNLLPCRHNGPKRFWEDFKKIAGRECPGSGPGNVAYITADPRDCLAFGSPFQVLSAACMGAASSGPDVVRRVAAEMEIEALLDQPIRTLSGGESVKLALAKVLAASEYSTRLVVASPFSWLSTGNRTLFDRVLDCYNGKRIPSEILVLDGEDDLTPLCAAELWHGDMAETVFTMEFSGASIGIGSPINAITEEQPRVRVEDFCADLVSPCLLMGGNGQGKSLLAKSLAGAIGVRGKVQAASGGVAGRARLLFQDVVAQTLLRSFNGIVASVRSSVRRRTLRLYERLCEACRESLGEDSARLQVSDNRRRTLLEIKMILIAARMAEGPPALVLDEPDWGLSRRTAIALVAAVVGIAHARGVPVVMISHKPWWAPVAGSVVNVAKIPPDGSDYRFAIRLQKM